MQPQHVLRQVVNIFKKLNLQFVTHSNLQLLSSAVLNCSVGYMLLVVKYDLTSLPPEYDEGCGLQAEQCKDVLKSSHYL